MTIPSQCTMCPTITIGYNGAYRCKACGTGVCRHMGLHKDGYCPECHKARHEARERKNADRIMSIEALLRPYIESCDDSEESKRATAIVDLLADLYHYCQHYDVDLQDCQRIAQNHFTTELGLEQKE